MTNHTTEVTKLNAIIKQRSANSELAELRSIREHLQLWQNVCRPTSGLLYMYGRIAQHRILISLGVQPYVYIRRI